MNKILRWFCENIADTLALPTRLSRTLSENPDMRISIEEPERMVSARSVVQWGEWPDQDSRARNSKTSLRGWRMSGYGYTGTTIEVPELGQLVKCEVNEHWSCDISQIDGLSASKAPIDIITGMDNFAEQYCKNLVDEISEEKLLQNLAHNEIRIIHCTGTSDRFARYEWDGRTFLINSGGSHHFAAARYIAKKLDRPVMLQGRLHRYCLNLMAVDELCHKFDIFAIKCGSAYREIFDPLKSFQASFFTLALPRPYEGVDAIFLPRTERRSTVVADALRKAKYFDLGAHLIELASRQDFNDP